MSSLHILIVEDSEPLAAFIAEVLDMADLPSQIVGTVAETRAIVEAGGVDLIILDWNLPDGQGDQLCNTIKRQAGDTFLPILMLTARDTVADRVAGLQAGADDYLTKPFHIDELLARVRALLRIRSAEVARKQALEALQQQHSDLQEAYRQLTTAQAKLIQTARLAALGSLVAGVTHELNNPLAIILGNAELLQTFSADGQIDTVSVQQIIEATHRARRVVQSLATFARQSPNKHDWYEPRDLLERVLDLRRTSLARKGIAIQVQYQAALPMICVDRQQIQHALLNLLLNAEEALAGRPDPRVLIRVFTSGPPIDAPPLLPVYPEPVAIDLTEPHMLVIDIMDNGPGINASIRDRLFEPFVTTSTQGKGIGLGLATAYGSIAQHGGTILVSTKPDCGTTFRIVLPLTQLSDFADCTSMDVED